MTDSSSERAEELAALAEALTARQRAFADALVEGAGEREAAIRAGYSPKTAASQAAQLVKNPKVAAYRRARSIALFSQMGISPEWVGLRLVEVVERCMEAKPHLSWDSERHAYVEDGSWVFDSRGATAALRQIGMSLGMFKADRAEGERAVSVRFEVAAPEEGLDE